MATASARALRGPLLAAVLLAPLLLPVLHGLGGAVQTVFSGQALAGGSSLWPNGRVGAMLANGLLLSALAALLATAIGALYALALVFSHTQAWRLCLVGLLTASFCFGTVVHLLAWRMVFPVVSGGEAGWAVAVLTLALRYAPLAAALLVAGLATMERAELETALCTGGGRALWVVGRTRLQRLAGMSFAAVFALVFSESELPPLLGVHVYAEEFLSQVALEPAASVAAALGWPLMAVALACAALLAGVPRLRPSAAGAVSMGWIGRWDHAPATLSATASGAAFGVAALPLLLLALGSVQATGRWPPHAGAALLNSVLVAGLSALAACLWGWALAGWAGRANGFSVTGLNVLLWIMMLWPSALIGIALAGSALPDWTGAVTPLILAHSLHLLPFAAWVLLAMREAQPRGPFEQLRLLGARGPNAIRHVHLPDAWPGLVAAFMLCAGLSMAELTATVLTVPPGMETAILRLYNLMHYGDHRGVMMLALAQGLIVALGAAAGIAVFGRRRAGD